ncbi:MAG: sulfurtransferase-like selenium metabolism protein YedF [Chloroflexi bacterium]|nr:sulfurtransferase-like selenium metabolism protein YedF [Chloroflexota bacterium]
MPGEKERFADSVLFIGSDVVGRGESHELGSLLMQRFLHEVGGRQQKPGTVIFMNSGVKLVTQDSLSLEEIKQLEAQGVEVLACGTCLNYFNLTGKVAAGRISNMSDITQILLKARKVISI